MINTFKKVFIVGFLGIMIFAFVSCEDEFMSDTSEEKMLSFSQDTLSFNSVFTTIGSATSKIMVYNTHNKAIKIDRIGIAGGRLSSFRVNVDGTISLDNTFNDIVIRAKDSLYIFVEVGINTQDVNSPVLVLDSIEFNIGSTYQRILLEAYGQNVEPLRSLHITSDTTLNADRPYLIYGDLTVDSAKTLTLLPGCKLYFHNDANLIIYGNLKAEGSFDAPIVLRGDRLDKAKFTTPIPYEYIAGQWGGVYLLSKTGSHILKHVNISSGNVGIYFYNDDVRYRPKLEIFNSVIHNFLLYNLVAVNGDLVVANSEISNSKSYTVYLSGGRHEFYHCTIANYFQYNRLHGESRDMKDPAVMLMDLNRTLPMETVFKNCIISGTSSQEFTLASKYQTKYQAEIRNSYIRRDTLHLPIFNNMCWYQYPDTTIFKKTSYDSKNGLYFDFTPDSISPAIGIADPVISAQFPLDLHGKNRLLDRAPDAGAYEWYPTITP